MLRQVRALLLDPELETLLAAPPRELTALRDVLHEPGYPLPESEAVLVQIRAGIALGRWARASKVEFLHGHGLKRLLLYVVAAKVARLPLAMTLHNLVPNQQRVVLRLLLQQASSVIAVSPISGKFVNVAVLEGAVGRQLRIRERLRRVPKRVPGAHGPVAIRFVLDVHVAHGQLPRCAGDAAQSPERAPVFLHRTEHGFAAKPVAVERRERVAVG